VSCMRALLSGGAIAERPGIGGVTPLHLASVNHHHIVSRVLFLSASNI
jgi:hypothetical protein